MDSRLTAALKNLDMGSQIPGVTSSGTAQGGSLGMGGEGEEFVVTSPIDGSEIATFKSATREQADGVIDAAAAAFLEWRIIPAPIRGEFVRLIGEELRASKEDLAAIVSWEAGKITQEALGKFRR